MFRSDYQCLIDNFQANWDFDIFSHPWWCITLFLALGGGTRGEAVCLGNNQESFNKLKHMNFFEDIYISAEIILKFDDILGQAIDFIVSHSKG